MARKLKSSSVESVNDDAAKNLTAQQAVTMPSPSPSPGPAVSDAGAGPDAIHKRLRTLRKKLQRVEAAESRKASQETAGSVKQEFAAPSKAAVLRAVVKELEELGQSIGGSTAGTGAKANENGPRIEYSAPQKKRDIDVSVSVQTLRLAYAATDGLAKAGASCISDPERHKLTRFYGMLLAGVGIGAADEKLSPAPTAIAKHLRQLALRETANVAGMDEMDYEELSKIVDRVLGYANGGDRATQLASDVLCARSADSRAVIMPALKCMSIRSDGSDAENGDFNGHVVVPPGGISFIASADVVDDTDSEEMSANEVLAVTTAGGLEPSIAVEVSSGVVMPLPLNMDGAYETVAKRVGGFAQPFPTNVQAPGVAPNNDGDAVEAADNSQHNGAAATTPAPDSHPGVNGVTLPPPVGFNGYGAPPTGVISNWAVTTAPPGVAAAATMPGIPSGFGVMPMLYPPHIAMQYGYLPPHMYNMLGVNTAGIGANPLHSGQSPPASGDASAAVAVEPAAQQAPPSGGGVPGVVHGEIWGADVKSAGASTVGGDEVRLGSYPPAMGTARALDGVPAPPPMMSMPSSDPHQQAMAMAAAAGFTMNPSFMYPHIDASNLSTAATGGSENNDSVNSVDSASNRGGSSRPDSIQVQQQQQQVPSVQSQQQVADVGSRGFVQAAVPEYPPAAQYMWSQPQQPADHSKNMAQGVYNYMYQQPQQPYYHSHQGQGYRQRGSGGSSNSGGSGGQHHGQPRERRSNPGYHRQQRWSNNNNNGHHYSRQSHSATTASAQSAGASSHHGNDSNSQESHDNSSNFNSVGNWQ